MSEEIKVGDLVEFTGLPGYYMTVEAVQPCLDLPERPPPHDQVRITDPEGRKDWVCALDVVKVGVSGDRLVTDLEAVWVAHCGGRSSRHAQTCKVCESLAVLDLAVAAIQRFEVRPRTVRADASS